MTSAAWLGALGVGVVGDIADRVPAGVVTGWLAAVALGALAVARRHFSPRRILFYLAGFAGGGVLGAVPGACFLVPARNDTGADPVPFHWIVPLLLTLSGGAAGAVAGLAAVDRATSPVRPRAWAWAAALVGFAAGAAVSVPAVVFTAAQWEWGAWLALTPLCVAAAAVAGYALPAPR